MGFVVVPSSSFKNIVFPRCDCCGIVWKAEKFDWYTNLCSTRNPSSRKNTPPPLLLYWIFESLLIGNDEKTFMMDELCSPDLQWWWTLLKAKAMISSTMESSLGVIDPLGSNNHPITGLSSRFYSVCVPPQFFIEQTSNMINNRTLDLWKVHICMRQLCLPIYGLKNIN